MPVNPFLQSLKEKLIYVHKNSMNPIREKKVENNVKIEEKEEEKEKENVLLNPFGSLSLFSKYIFKTSDLHTKIKTLPTIKIMGTMDLRDSTLEEQGSCKIIFF